MKCTYLTYAHVQSGTLLVRGSNFGWKATLLPPVPAGLKPGFARCLCFVEGKHRCCYRCVVHICSAAESTDADADNAAAARNSIEAASERTA